LNLGKPGVSFARSPGADRYPSELTRAGSVLGRPMEIVRLRAFWSRGWRRWAQAALFCDGARRKFAGVGRKQPSGLETMRGLALESAHGTIKLPRASMWVCRKRSGARSGGGGSARWRLAGIRVYATPGLDSGRERDREQARSGDKPTRGLCVAL